MRTRMLLWPLAAVLALAAQAQEDFTSEAPLDTTALMVLDHMAENIGALHACSFHLTTMEDAVDPNTHMVTKQLDEHDVHLSGADRMQVNSNGDKGHCGYWYDSTQVVYYSYTDNNYGFMPAAGTTIETIDSLHRSYNIDFPAADLFYPTFVDDLVAQSYNISYVGNSTVAGIPCYHISALGTKQDMELWIANDGTFLPQLYVITDRKDGITSELQGWFTDWQVNPDLPDALFSFVPPPRAQEMLILPIAIPTTKP